MNAITPTTADAPIQPGLEPACFHAEVRPIYDEDGVPIDPSIARGVYRTDNDLCIATCGSNFKPIQHYDVLNPILSHFADRGYEVDMTRRTDRRSLYDLQGRKGVFGRVATDKNGAVMRADFITGDFISPTGSSNYLDSGPDTMLFKVSVLNSHNGSLAVHINFSYERLICMNGITKPDFSAGVYGKHTSSFAYEAMCAQIDNALEGMTDDADTFGRWARKRITETEAEHMLKRTIAKMVNRRGAENVSDRLVDQILNRFVLEDQTAWGLYQAITWWQTHGEMKANASELTGRINRETRVAKLLRSREWQALAA